MKNTLLQLHKITLIGLFLTFNAQISRSQSDECATAPALTVGTSCVTSNWNVQSSWTTSGIANPGCASANFRDGWFSFVATSATSNVNCTNSNRTMAVAVYSSCAAASLLACADAVATQGTETLNVPTVAGNTYYIRIIRTNNDNNNDMTGTICVTSTVSST